MKLLHTVKRRKVKKVKADIEHLRKLFIMPDSPDKFMEFGYELLDLIHSFFKGKGGIHSEIPLPELAKIFSETKIPKEPCLLKDGLREIKEKIISHSVKVGNPYYIGHMTSAIPYFMILLEMIIAALNQNQVKIETAKASTFVERELIGWIHRLIYNRSEKFYKTHIQDPTVALGNVTGDGTLANLTALLVARNKAFPPDGRFPGIARAGVLDAFRYYNCPRAVILVSKRGHYSIQKVARLIGIGERNVIKVPVDSRNKINIQRLRYICSQIQKVNKNNNEKIKIVSMVGIAGTTETGNIDDLSQIRKISMENKSNFHVDAAWGGPVLFVNQFRYLFQGIEKADSVTFDSHKLLYSPLSMGMVLFRNENDLTHLKHTANYVIRGDSVDQGRFTIEGSRPFVSLKPWTTLKIFGASGFKLLFENAFDLTAVLRGLIERHCDFEPMNHPELFIFNYRFVPKKIQKELSDLDGQIEKNKKKRHSPQMRKIRQINEKLNMLNIELHKAIRKKDTSFVSRTKIESTKYAPQKIVVLRAVTINPLTTPAILKEIVNEHHKLGLHIYEKYFKKLLIQES